MTSQADKAAQFLALHQGPDVLLLPNPWDAGSARLFVSLGFKALATTSGGFAATLGRRDGDVTREEALEHATVVSGAVDVPVSADLENCFADRPADVAETITLALDTGLAGGSVEDWSGSEIYEAALAEERVAAAAEAAHGGDVHFVLTARTENYVHGRRELADTIDRLQRFQSAGADALYAPGLTDLDEIKQVIASVDLPVNVLAVPGSPTVAELAAAGVARVSVGSAFAYAALGGAVEAAKELQEHGTYGFWERAGVGAAAAKKAFAP